MSAVAAVKPSPLPANKPATDLERLYQARAGLAEAIKSKNAALSRSASRCDDRGKLKLRFGTTRLRV
jgi:hypothetical protein